ncbi:ATP-dependent exoDNAse (exonuclease V) beta subunit [Bradyrhizobium sp. GM0.4]
MVKAPRPIPDEVRARQARASDPSASAFVSANAGSGKTHVLVQRVIRLLLAGVPPEKILCITFTKAAAANMAERVFTTLGHWVTLDDTALDAAIRAVGIPHPTAKLRRDARKLFACALETPGGLKVQTIHALCTRLLQQFPFEANVPARFAVIRRARPDRHDGTRQSEGAAGGRARPRQRDRPRAADRDGERRRCHLQGGGARGLPEPRSLHGLDR